MTLTAPGSLVPGPPESVIEGSSAPSGSNTTPESDNAPVNATAASTVGPQQHPQRMVSIEDRLALKPYEFEGIENNPSPPTEALQLWIEVSNGIDKSQTGEYMDTVVSKLCGFAVELVEICTR